MQEFYESPSHCRFGRCTLALVSQQAAAVEYPLPAANSRLIGENQEYVVPQTTVRWSRSPPDFQLGLTNIMEANPGVDPYLPGRAARDHFPSADPAQRSPRSGSSSTWRRCVSTTTRRARTWCMLPIGIGQPGSTPGELDHQG